MTTPIPGRPPTDPPHPHARPRRAQVAALVDLAAGADARAIAGLEGVLSDLRAARDAKQVLARDVPAALVRDVLATRARGHAPGGRP